MHVKPLFLILVFKKLGRDGAVPLSNSLSLADRHRMNNLIKQNRTKDVNEYCPFKYGEYGVFVLLGMCYDD